MKIRKIQEIVFDYLCLLKKEGKIDFTKAEIESLSQDQAQQQEVLNKVSAELVDTEIHDGTKIFSLRSFKIFCEIVVKEDMATDQDVWNDFIKMQFELVEKHQLICYVARRGGGKSFFAALYIIHKMFTIQGYEVLMGFNIPKMIKRFFRVFRRLIDNNEWLATKKDPHNTKNVIWGQLECEYNLGINTGQTLGSTPRSAHVNLVWLDDLLRTDKKYSEEYIQNYVLGELMPCISVKKGRYVIEGTFVHDEDVYHYLALDENDKFREKLLLCTRDTIFKSKKGWACRSFPAILDHATKKVLCPERFTYEEIMNEKDRIGEFRWFRELMCQCKINKSALISYYLFMKCTDEKESLQETATEGKKYVMFVDPSAGEGAYSDYAGITVVEKGSKAIVRFLWHERLLPIIDPNPGGKSDLTHKVMDVFESFNQGSANACELWIENNNIGRILIQSVRKEGLDPLEHNTKEEKVEIIMNVIAMFKQEGKLILPYNPECSYTQEWMNILKGECMNFGLSKDNRGKISAGATTGHDDMFISCMFALHYAYEDETQLATALCQD